RQRLCTEIPTGESKTVDRWHAAGRMDSCLRMSHRKLPGRALRMSTSADVTNRADRIAQAHKWEFRARFRRHAFGWKSQPAIKRIKEAVAEIKKVARKDKVLAAEGAVLFLEKVSPALEHVDSSSGSIGTAVNNAI